MTPNSSPKCIETLNQYNDIQCNVMVCVWRPTPGDQFGLEYEMEIQYCQEATVPVSLPVIRPRSIALVCDPFFVRSIRLYARCCMTVECFIWAANSRRSSSRCSQTCSECNKVDVINKQLPLASIAYLLLPFLPVYCTVLGLRFQKLFFKTIMCKFNSKKENQIIQPVCPVRQSSTPVCHSIPAYSQSRNQSVQCSQPFIQFSQPMGPFNQLVGQFSQLFSWSIQPMGKFRQSVRVSASNEIEFTKY